MKTSSSRFLSDNPKPQIKNPKWISLLALVFGFALSGTVQSQPNGKVAHIGMLFIGGRDQPHLTSFKQGLRDRGYVEGKNIVLKYRYAEGRQDRLVKLAHCVGERTRCPESDPNDPNRHDQRQSTGIGSG